MCVKLTCTRLCYELSHDKSRSVNASHGRSMGRQTLQIMLTTSDAMRATEALLEARAHRTILTNAHASQEVGAPQQKRWE